MVKYHSLVVFLYIFSLLLTSSVTIQASPPSLSNRNIKIAVMEFQTQGSISNEENAILTDFMQSELNVIGGFDIVYRTDTKKLMDQKGISQDACSSVACLVNIGMLLNVDKIITGTIGKLGKVFAVSIQIINVENSKIEVMQMANYDGGVEGLDTIIADLTRRVINQIQIQDTGTFLSGGSSSFENPDFSKSNFSIEILFYGTDDTKDYYSTTSLSPNILSLSYALAPNYFLTGSLCLLKGDYTLNVNRTQSITSLLKGRTALWGKGLVSYGFGGGAGIRFWRLRGGIELFKFINSDTDLSPDMAIGVYAEFYVLRFLYLGLDGMMFNQTGLVDPRRIGPSVRSTNVGVHRLEWGPPKIITLRGGIDF